MMMYPPIMETEYKMQNIENWCIKSEYP